LECTKHLVITLRKRFPQRLQKILLPKLVYHLAPCKEMCRKEIYEAKYPESRAEIKRLKELKQYRSEIVSSRENAQSARAQCCGHRVRNIHRRYCFQTVRTACPHGRMYRIPSPRILLPRLVLWDIARQNKALHKIVSNSS